MQNLEKMLFEAVENNTPEEIKKDSIFDYIKSCPYKDKNYIFINPSIKCTVNFLERTNNNSLRHPVFKCLKM